MTPTPPPERRETPRRDSFLPVTLLALDPATGGSPIQGELLDVSDSGGWIETYASGPEPGRPGVPESHARVVGRRVRVEIGSDPRVARDATIVRVERRGRAERIGIAVRFDALLTEEERVRLRRESEGR